MSNNFRIFVINYLLIYLLMDSLKSSRSHAPSQEPGTSPNFHWWMNTISLPSVYYMIA